MHILAIDPGNELTAFVLFDDVTERILRRGHVPNSEMRSNLYSWECDDLTKLVIEMIASYGAAVGKEVFETVRWIGRFEEAATIRDVFDGPPELLYRLDVKMHLCHATAKINDSVIRQALIDRFGGFNKGIGGKKCGACKGKGWCGKGRLPCTACDESGYEHKPGPLYGVSGDEWAALALAVTFADRLRAVPTCCREEKERN